MKNEVTVNRLDRRFRFVLLAISILCALIPAVALILAVDADYRQAALAHDSAITAEAASQISLRIRSVQRQLDAARVLDHAKPSEDALIRSFLRAVKSSNHNLIKVGFGDGKESPRTASHELAPAGRLLPVYHDSGDNPYITVAVPLGGDGTEISAVLDGSTIIRLLRSLAGERGARAYLFTVGGRLLASSGAPSPQADFTPLAGAGPVQRVVTGPGGPAGTPLLGTLRSLASLRAPVRYVTETPVRGTGWVLLLDHTQHGLFPSRFPLIFGAASALFAALIALLAALLLPGSSRTPAKRRLEDAVRRNEMLLRETHHRVKNDLQILSSILHLSDRPDLDSGEHDILTESQNRVHAISLIHELLCKTSDLAAGVSMRVYVSELIKRIQSSLVGETGEISIVSNVGDFFFDADTSVVCGLLLNELVTNSLKYAFPNGAAGVILVALERVEAGRYLLRVEDDGVGLPEECRSIDGGSLGMRLIRALSEQLGGAVSVESERGTSWSILFDACEDAVAAVR